MISWLEMIIHESQLAARGGVQEEVEHLGEQTPSNPEGLYYVRHEYVCPCQPWKCFDCATFMAHLSFA